MPKLKNMTIAGRAVEVHVSDAGEFYADVAGDRVKAQSLSALKHATERILRRAGKIEVPATVLTDSSFSTNPPTMEDVVLTGKHGGSGRVMYRGVNGVEQRGYNETILRRLSDDEKALIEGAWKQQRQAAEHYSEMVDGFRIDADDAIETAAKAIEKGAADAV
jgi:hypothetical protein